MVEVMPIIKRWRRDKARDHLTEHHLRSMRFWEDSDQRQTFYESIHRQAYDDSTFSQTDDEELDREALQALRSKTGGSA